MKKSAKGQAYNLTLVGADLHTPEMAADTDTQTYTHIHTEKGTLTTCTGWLTNSSRMFGAGPRYV